MPEKHFWVNTVSLDHVHAGVAGSFTQADHGAATRLRRLRPDDGIVFYSPRTRYPDGQPVRQFTALGTVAGSEPYRVTMSADFHPWRVAVAFLPVRPVAATDLIDRLSFVTDPKRWGMPFRRGLFPIPAADFLLIATAMRSPTFRAHVADRSVSPEYDGLPRSKLPAHARAGTDRTGLVVRVSTTEHLARFWMLQPGGFAFPTLSP